MKKEETKFYRTVLAIAVPVTLQSILQSSFGIVDQVMTGQLGSISIAGIGLASRFVSVFTVLVAAIATTAGIMIAQYMGKKEKRQVSRSFWVNLLFALVISVGFTVAGLVRSEQIMQIYTKDAAVCHAAAQYLRIISLSFVPIAIASLISPLLRCMEAAVLPLYAGIGGAVINTILNYILIFGRGGGPELGIEGAAIATVISQLASCGIMVAFLLWHTGRAYDGKLPPVFHMTREEKTQYFGILLPILVCEFVWSMGENVYGIIYGHMGTLPCAAMTLTGAVQGLMIGALTGISQAAGVIIGKTLGSGAYERAYREAKKLMGYGMLGSLILSVFLISVSSHYVDIYSVEAVVKDLAMQILFFFAFISPVKVQNMIVGGIIRSGGKTKYVMWIDFIGTWLFGVPLGLLSAFVFHLDIPYVYLLLSLEECVRLGICLYVFRKRSWMKVLGEQSA